ncbi:MAG TPA: tributyrin esterase, partial [Methanobacterium sp.]|nr:tributyrin esterase [Methanobacterium sp.]
KTFSTRQLNKQVRKALSEEKNNIILEKTSKLDSIAVGLDKKVNIILDGDVGDFVGSLNNGAHIKIQGNAGRYVGDNMTSGEIIVKGSAQDGVGFGIYNGIIVVYGDAGDGVGQLNKGGTILINGNMGDLAGLYMLSGDIIVTGDSGEDTGNWMIGGTIYVGGKYHTGSNLEIHGLDTADKRKLAEIFKKYEITATIDDFIKLKPKDLRPFYGNEVMQ